MDEIVITNGDRVSELWGKLMRRNAQRIAEAHLQLESSLSIEDTNRVRGRLIELRQFERLDQIEPLVP